MSRSRPQMSLVLGFLVFSTFGCEEKNDETGGPLSPAGLAVINSDYVSATISLVNPTTGLLVKDACISSGSTPPKLTTPLSGDVVLPSHPQIGHELVVIDRSNATLTWIDPMTCDVLRQINIGMGWAANPHDYVAVSATKAYVTRYGTNPTNAAEGSDLLIIDPSVPSILGRVDLSALAGAAIGGKALRPGPDRALLLNGNVYVTLNNLSADYKVAGAGRIAVVDPVTDTASLFIEAPTFKNCGAITAPGAGGGFAMTCAGLFEDGADQISASGIAYVDIGTDPPTLRTVPATGFGRPVSGFDVALTGTSGGFAITSGEFAGPPPDQLWIYDFSGGAPMKVLDATAGFTFAGLLFDDGNDKLFLSDANDTMPRLRVFDVANPAAPVELPSIATSAAGLPPRTASFY